MAIEIFVCYHKEYPKPKSDTLIPIHVGKDISQQELNILTDNTGDNISSKNKHFCELTATYWIWKNSKADVKGLFHYRRFFNLRNGDRKFNRITDTFCNDFGLDEANINKLIKENDVLLPLLIKNSPKKNPPTVYDHYAKDHVQSDMDCLLEVIKEKYPNMAKIADKIVKEEISFYNCNMLVARKDIFDEYASWLFDILFEVEKRIHADVLTRDNYQQRVYGFLSERMMRIFIEYKKETSNIKVKEVPILYIEEDPKAWKKYQIKRIKHKILKIFGIRKDL